MDYPELMSQLEALGSEQTRKTYRNHGVRGAQFGVSFANLDKVAKQINKDKTIEPTALARQLWASGNNDARILATKIANPAQLDSETIDAWAQDLDNYMVSDAFGVLVGRSPYARQKVAAWVDAPQEFISASGWNMLGQLALEQPELPDVFFTPYLEIIQAQIHTRPNRTRYSMNNALIAIGIRNHNLEDQALTTAAAVGEVYVDHGVTNCKTPFAPDYIKKSWAYKETKAAGKKG